MTKHINLLNVTAESFDLEKFAEIVNNVRRTQKVIATADDTHAELIEKLKAAQVNLQKSLSSADWDGVQKFTAEAKRTSMKLEENPVEKVQEFDAAVDALANFCMQSDGENAEQTAA